jgi:MFS family permease
VETIDAEDTAKAEGHGPQRVLAALGNWRVWYFALIYFCIQIAVYGFTFFLPTQVVGITGQKLGFQASLVTAIPWVFALIAVAIFPRIADRTRKHRLIGSTLLLVTAFGIFISGSLSNNPVLAISGLCLAAIGFVSMQPIFWTLPTEYMTGYAAAAGIGLINSLGNLGGFLAPIQREYFDSTLGGNAGLYSLAVGAVLGAVLFAITAFFKKANEVEAGHLDEVDAHYVPHDVAEAARGPHPSHR